MLKPADKVVAGVSGGADSVCLFLLLWEYAKRVPLQLAVVHVNHGIRREAGEDARFVEELCREREIPFYLEEADVRGLAKREGCSEEDAGRRVRYEAFSRVAGRLGGARIAVAHNSNDNAETMLFHLFRGSGIQGLSGIAPVRGNIIRPILCLERKEVEAYLESGSVQWCRDITNDGDDYRRNRIRHHILPYAEEAVVSGAVVHMGRTAELLRETEAYMELQTREAVGKCVTFLGQRTQEACTGAFQKRTQEECTGDLPQGKQMEGFRIRKADFREFHRILQKRIIFRLLKQLSPAGKDISAVHVLDVLGLFEREGNGSISLPFGITARRQYDSVFLERCESRTFAGQTGGFFGAGGAGERNDVREGEAIRESGAVKEGNALPSVQVPAMAEIFHTPFVYGLGNRGKIEFTGFSIKKGQEVPIKRYTKWFDYDKIVKCVEIRSRCQGDYLTIADGRGNIIRKTVKNYMITEKIPKQIRDEIPVVAVGSHVVWLAGWRISEAFKVNENTERILQIKLLGAEFCEDGETEEKNGGEH